jgi:hypothetical protein
MGAEIWDDPHGLVPEAFKNTFPEHDSVRDALRHAERLASSTPPEDRAGVCPDCGSVAISPIGTHQGGGSEYDWKCNECEHRFTDPDKTDLDEYDHTEHYRFNFLDGESLLNPARRTELDRPFDYPDPADPEERRMGPLFAGLDRETLIALVLVLREPWTEAGPTYAEIAELVPYKRSWVGHRVREWRDGEHRELVPDPTADPEPITVDDSGATAVATDGGRRRWDAYGS